MRRALDARSSDALVVAAGLASATVAYLDLLGPDAIWQDWGERSLYSFGTVVAFLVPVAIVAQLRRERRAGRAWVRWPDVMIGAAAAALASTVIAHAIGEGGVLGLLASVVGAAAIAYAATRVRP